MDNKENNDVVDNSNDIVINETEKKEIEQIHQEVKEEKVNETTEKKEDNGLTIPKEKRLGAKIDNNKKRKIVMISLIVIMILILISGTFVCINKLNTNVYKNVYVLGQNISGYSSEEVKEFLTRKNKIEYTEKIDIMQDSECIYNILESDLDVKININSTLNNVMAFGRSGNIFKDSFDILFAKIKKVEIEPAYTYNEEKLDEIIKNIDISIKDRYVESKYVVDEEKQKLVITIGKSGNGIDLETEKNNIVNLISKNFTGEKFDKKIYLNIKLTSKIDLDPNEVYNNIKKAPQDAYIDKSSDPAKLIAEVVGLDIELSVIEQTLNLEENKEEGKVLEIPLTVIEPSVKLEDLDKELYSEKIAGYTTYFDPGQYARSNNLKIALEYLNGKIIMPGEVFSYNAVIGDTTAERGYLPAATFKGGTTVNEMGGGICQTTSTLYNVVLMANLEIVERHQHGLPVGYVKPSLDATVYSPYLDFKFKNTRSNPIKIVTSFSSSGNLNVSLYGIKEKEEYEVELISEYLGTIPYTTKYIYDSNMNEGEQIVVSNGVNGYTSQSYISKKLNGVQVSYELLSKDTYNAQQKVVKVGTKKVNNIQGS